MAKEDNLINALKSLSSFKIKKNRDKIDLNIENPGWEESEEDYKKAQQEWLKKVKNKKK